MNDSDIRQMFLELAKVQAEIGTMVSGLSESQISLFRILADLPDIPESSRLAILEGLERTEPQLSSLRNTIERFRKSLSNPPVA